MKHASTFWSARLMTQAPGRQTTPYCKKLQTFAIKRRKIPLARASYTKKSTSTKYRPRSWGNEVRTTPPLEIALNFDVAVSVVRTATFLFPSTTTANVAVAVEGSLKACINQSKGMACGTADEGSPFCLVKQTWSFCRCIPCIHSP